MTALSSRFSDALVYAAQAHAGQTRKASTIPYLAHPLAVAALVLEHGATEDEAIAALLHDVVEDCGGLPRLEDVRRRFGDDVARIVIGCTDATETPKPPWRARKQAYIEHLARAEPSVLLIVACDKLHNVRSLLAELQGAGPAVWSHFRGGKDGTLWYYRAVIDALGGTTVPARLLRDLKAGVDALDREANDPNASPASTHP